MRGILCEKQTKAIYVADKYTSSSRRTQVHALSEAHATYTIAVAIRIWERVVMERLPVVATLDRKGCEVRCEVDAWVGGYYADVGAGVS